VRGVGVGRAAKNGGERAGAPARGKTRFLLLSNKKTYPAPSWTRCWRRGQPWCEDVCFGGCACVCGFRGQAEEGRAGAGVRRRVETNGGRLRISRHSLAPTQHTPKPCGPLPPLHPPAPPQQPAPPAGRPLCPIIPEGEAVRCPAAHAQKRSRRRATATANKHHNHALPRLAAAARAAPWTPSNRPPSRSGPGAS